MKRILIVFLFALLLGGNSFAQGVIYPVVTGDAVYGEGADTLNVNEPLSIDIYIDNTAGGLMLGWMTTFELYGTGNVSEVNYGPDPVILSDDFLSIFGMYSLTHFQDMDGISPDTFAVGGITMGGLYPGVHLLMISINMEIVGDYNTDGMFCIDSAVIPSDYTYDWMFPPPVIFIETCWPVKAPPFKCGDASHDGAVNLLDVTYMIGFIYQSGPPPFFTRSADVNNSCSINILDVTLLISYLYMAGTEPLCPPEWPCGGDTTQVKNGLTDQIPVEWVK